MRRIGIGMAALAAGLIVVCAQAGAETIRFGGILPLTGPGALIGTAADARHPVRRRSGQCQRRRARQQDRGAVRGQPGQARPVDPVSFNKLTDLQHVPVIFTAYSGPSLAMAPLATRKKVLMVNAGAQADKLATASPYLINTLPTIGDEIEVMSKYLTGEGKKQAGDPVRE